ncbi:MAG TPA: shikimate kinase [Acidimicrobiales bacterium]|nr:shikimate kinase [Acidimicrobiales bacterium]
MGVSGLGKTTAGRRLAASLSVPFIELDAIFHQAGWRDLPTDEFRERVRDAVAADAWVIDGNYQAVSDLVWDRADAVIWVDLSRFVIMRRVVARTMRRALTGEELWNGNREPLSNFYSWDPEKNVIRWAWIMYPRYAERYALAMANAKYENIQFIRLTSPQAVEAFLSGAPA